MSLLFPLCRKSRNHEPVPLRTPHRHHPAIEQRTDARRRPRPGRVAHQAGRDPRWRRRPGHCLQLPCGHRGRRPLRSGGPGRVPGPPGHQGRAERGGRRRGAALPPRPERGRAGRQWRTQAQQHPGSAPLSPGGRSLLAVPGGRARSSRLPAGQEAAGDLSDATMLGFAGAQPNLPPR
ncbi:hypothetical protein COLO4_02474, partial [Corchorus olitorius]